MARAECVQGQFTRHVLTQENRGGSMTIGIIGAGNIGQAVAKRLASAGIPASIANNRGPSSLSSIVQNLGVGITAAEIKVAAKADIVLLAVPWSAYADA